MMKVWIKKTKQNRNTPKPKREYLSWTSGAFFVSCKHFGALSSGTKHPPPPSNLGGCHFEGSKPASHFCIQHCREGSLSQSDVARHFLIPT